MIGLGRSGRAAALWLARQPGIRVYASDRGDAPASPEQLAALRQAGVVVETGGHDLSRIEHADGAVVSPGVPPDAAPVRAARAAGMDVLAELELGWRALRAQGTRFIVITGTNGKSTTTTITAQVLARAGIPAVAAGNIGRPLLDVALAGERPDWVVAEASSFQLHDTPRLAPDVTVLTNLAPNHLDRYPDVAAYYADKARLYVNATDATVHILNADDAGALALPGGAAGTRRTFALDAAADATLRDGKLVLDRTPMLSRDRLPLIGAHNVQNALAAALAARAAGLDVAAIGAGLAQVTGLPHRLELVRTAADVQWINDSKSTNVTSTVVAVRAMDRPFALLLGGRHKGEPYTAIAEAAGERCRGVIAFGESSARIADDVRGRLEVVVVPDLTAAVERAEALVRPGDAVLLSPACSSYDQFSDYEERGAAFRRLAEAR